MSTLVYGALNAQREAAPAKTSKESQPPGIGTYVDVIVALVPAEVLALNAFLLDKLSESSDTAQGDPLTKVTNPADLKLVFWLSIALSIVFYFSSERMKANSEARHTEAKVEGAENVKLPLAKLNWLKALIPAAAYVVWTMLQHPSAFDGISDLSENTRLIIAVFAAAGLGLLAKVLGDKTDRDESPLSRPPVPPSG